MTSQVNHLPESVQSRANLDIHPGDTVRIQVKVPDKGGNFRLQAFEGLVIARKHGSEAGATITVRKISHGVGVERVFPIYSPTIESFELLKRSIVRRSKLYYIRDKVAREIRRKMRNFVSFVGQQNKKANEVVAEIADTPEVESTPEVAEQTA